MIQYYYIAGQTPLDADEKQALIPNIICREDLDKWEQENILEARKWLMYSSKISNIDILSEKFLMDLHRRMFKYVWKWAGERRKTNKNIGVEFYKITHELKNLLDDANFWINNNTYSIEDIAIIFHHRLVKIHIFANGNGRHARLVADGIIKKYNGNNLSWGGDSSLMKPDIMRKNYIVALKEADKGDYELLLEFAK
jgi:Fic-DOC domain mobile mystery protein B